MRGLQVEGLLDFGIRGYEEVEEDEGRYEEREEDIYRMSASEHENEVNS